MFSLTLVLIQIFLVAQSILASLPDLPPRANILQTFLFQSSGPLVLNFKDTFCPGLATLIWDNNSFLGTTPSIQNFCGISVRGDSSIIVSPVFTEGNYPLASGFHNLTVLVYGSPTPNGKATTQLTLIPKPGSIITMKSTQRTQLTFDQAKQINKSSTNFPFRAKAPNSWKEENSLEGILSFGKVRIM